MQLTLVLNNNMFFVIEVAKIKLTLHILKIKIHNINFKGASVRFKARLIYY